MLDVIAVGTELYLVAAALATSFSVIIALVESSSGDDSYEMTPSRGSNSRSLEALCMIRVVFSLSASQH